eukprot:Hpha_TRINITY_DN28194_c0_g1::TRINITY_DN28194_c0_g1_i1::g.103307::m.103307
MTKRHSHACAVLHDCLYVFGGLVLSDSKTGHSSDLWCLDLSGQRQWRELLNSYPCKEDTDDGPAFRPEARAHHSLAAACGQLVLFGGQSNDGRCLADTWVW